MNNRKDVRIYVLGDIVHFVSQEQMDLANI
jgi:UDP-2,3-diacylglucosamine pyrophosphatase LpxH